NGDVESREEFCRLLDAANKERIRAIHQEKRSRERGAERDPEGPSQAILPTDFPPAAISDPTTSIPKKRKWKTNAERSIYFCPIQGCPWAEGSDGAISRRKDVLTSNHCRDHVEKRDVESKEEFC